MDWKSTLNLPRTEFPMRADLAKREPAWLARWEKEGHYRRIVAERARDGAERFVLHDGPPYPTGGIHYGTVLNKVLKDIVVRSRLLMGKHAPFRPGWDCHGLPIEQQVEKDLGGKRAELSVAEFRECCRAHAMKYVGVMRAEFMRLGCVGDWDDPYLTLAPEYEATVVRQLAEFARAGLLYRDKKPVHWCLTHRTALAEAEVEYRDHASPSIYVRFPLPDDVARGVLGAPAALVIWTTTPWTLPANLAIVANPKLDYVGIPHPATGEWLVVARALADSFQAACGLEVAAGKWHTVPADAIARLRGARYRHPFLATPRAEVDFRVWFADHATAETGTGLVHTAPGHGADDYRVGREQGLAIRAPVDDAGRFTDDVGVPAWAGLLVFDANPKIVAALAASGHLLNRAGDKVQHQYPCCWRCKKPVIFRGTEQWFARMDPRLDSGPLGPDGPAPATAGLRQIALGEIEKTRWIPEWGKERIRGMIETRPDWCLSRQRTWGVPIPAFKCGGCGNVMLRAAIADHVADLFAREGSNAWFTRPAGDLLPAGAGPCDRCGAPPAKWEKGADIVDVWFESGVSWAAVCEDRLVPRGEKVDLYLEGSDQHRGWFHSALLTGAATRGQAPYQAVLTCGWVIDERGKAYSKSEIAKARESGAKIDYVDPAVWMERNGAEILRFWTASADYQRDIVFSKTIIDQLGESYRRIRNTCKYLLGNLYDFVPSKDALHEQELEELDKGALAVLYERDHAVWRAYRAYAFHDAMRLLGDYCVTASAEYIDPIKDRLYCETPASPRRRSAQTVVEIMTRTIAGWMAPVLCFTAQDVADHLGQATGEPFDVHASARREDVEAQRKSAPGGFGKWWQERLRPNRELILKQLEPFRAAGHKTLEAAVTVKVPEALAPEWSGMDRWLPELCIVSKVAIDTVPGGAGDPVEVLVTEAPGPACPRCWRRTGERSGDVRDPDLCRRCAAAVPS